LKGIVPDIVIPSPLDAIDLGEENLPNAMEWDAVPPARYRPVADLSPAVKILRRQSADRLAKDEKFAAYLRMIKRLEEIRAAEELPLNLDKRRELARAEQEFSSLENELETREDGGEEPKDKKRPDLVLEEALRILADFIPLYTQAAAGYAPASGDEKKTFSEKIGDWIRSVQ
jgi:carboxyl-terminal processing protease